MALVAAAAEDEPAQQWKIFPPGESVGAVSAMGVRDGDTFAFGDTGDHDIEKAAEGQAEQSCEDYADELEIVRNWFWLLC